MSSYKNNYWWTELPTDYTIVHIIIGAGAASRIAAPPKWCGCDSPQQWYQSNLFPLPKRGCY
jgi:hypothetical protein